VDRGTDVADDLWAYLQPLVERLAALAAGDAEFRRRLRGLADALDAQAAESGPAPAPVVTVAEPPCPLEPPVPVPVAAVVATPAPNGPVPVFAPPVEYRPAPPPAVSPAVLVSREEEDDQRPTVEARCRLKAEGCRWAAAWLRVPSGGLPPGGYQDLIDRAGRVPDCYLWMCVPGSLPGSDPAAYERLAGCFEAAAEAAALLRRLADAPPTDREGQSEALHLAAEAQSALRLAVSAVGRDKDRDQIRLYIWVKETAGAGGFWVGRFLRSEDPADPAGSAGLRERLGQCEARLQATAGRAKARAKLLNNLRFKLSPKGRTADGDRDWGRIWEIVDELVGGGMPPSDLSLREALLPVRGELPDGLELPATGRLVLREIDRFLASRPTESVAEAEAPPTPEVRRAAELLRGRAVVLIGGTPSPPHKAALEEAFGLSEVVWIETREHQTHMVFEPYVARADVALVLLAIRWSSHGFSEVKGFCDKYGKPLVHLPRGYSPNQVAHEIVNQAADRLASAG
jgi:hypothetical protein